MIQSYIVYMQAPQTSDLWSSQATAAGIVYIIPTDDTQK